MEYHRWMVVCLLIVIADSVLCDGEVVAASKEESEFTNLANEAIKEMEEQHGCDPRFYSLSTRHTMCLKSPPRESEGITEADKRLILDFHNEARANVGDDSGDTGSNIQQMVWDDELAKMAQNWASNCQNFHDDVENRVIPGKYHVGQNIALFSYKVWQSALQIWYNERYHFKYGVGPQGYRKEVGHYTQMIWAKSTRIGCGYANCKKNRHLYVCNYGPAGNVASWKDPAAQFRPYELGLRGDACPDSFNLTSRLCDCNGKVCHNGGTLNPNTCECECKNIRWIGHEGTCELECDRAHDSIRCASLGGIWSRGECSKFANLPYEYCPITCGWCPMQNGKYWDSSEIPIVIPPAFESSTPGTVKSTPPPTTPKTSTIAIIDEDEIEEEESSGESELSSGEPSESTPSEEESDLPKCEKMDSAECGQPSSKYFGKALCYSKFIKERCPAMCGYCQAQECIDYDGEIHELGDTWVTSFGRFTCNVNGAEHERGCMREGEFVSPLTSYSYDKEDYRWTCECNVVGFSYQLFCSGQRQQ